MSICADQVEEAFEEGGGTYSADRIEGKLRKRGFTASFGEVKRIMNSRGLFLVRLLSLRESRGARDEDRENLLHNLPVTLLSDITYVPTGEDFAYTCATGMFVRHSTGRTHRLSYEEGIGGEDHPFSRKQLTLAPGRDLPFRPRQPIHQRGSNYGNWT